MDRKFNDMSGVKVKFGHTISLSQEAELAILYISMTYKT